MRTAWEIIKQTVSEFFEDRAMVHAAAIAYYTIFSLGPILIIVLAVAGAVYGSDAVQGELQQQLSATMGEGAAVQIQEMIKNASQSREGRFATIFSMVMLLIAATGVFGQLQQALNTIWEVQPRPGRGIWGYVMSRLLAFGVVVLIAVLIMALITASTAVAAAGHWIEQWISVPVWATQIIEAMVSFGILTVLFAMIFKFLPDVKIRLRDMWLGATVTALLFAVGKIGLGWYLGRASTTSVYGAAGSLVAILLFVYYSSLIFLFGAEFTQVYAKRFGAEIQPASYAERIADPDETPAASAHPKPNGKQHRRREAWESLALRRAAMHSSRARTRRAQTPSSAGQTSPSKRSIWQQIRTGLVRGFTEPRPSITSCPRR